MFFYQLHHLTTAKTTSNLSEASDKKQRKKGEIIHLTYKLIYTSFFLELFVKAAAFSFQSFYTTFTLKNNKSRFH